MKNKGNGSCGARAHQHCVLALPPSLPTWLPRESYTRHCKASQPSPSGFWLWLFNHAVVGWPLSNTRHTLWVLEHNSLLFCRLWVFLSGLPVVMSLWALDHSFMILFILPFHRHVSPMLISLQFTLWVNPVSYIYSLPAPCLVPLVWSLPLPPL